MKIVVIVRTRNESKRIGKFCEAYKNADHIIVSDGGSEDDTVSIAQSYPNVILSPFHDRVELKNGTWRNNDASHANHLITEAKKLAPDWIIYDDCDCRPNVSLKLTYRSHLENTDKNFVMVTRFYFWGTEEYFPKMSSPGGKIEPSLWAWRGNLNFEMIDVPPAYNFRLDGRDIKDLHFDSTVLDIFPPDALLHYSWDDERVQQKIKDYHDSGFIQGFTNPLQWAGQKVPKESWMVE